ncbi:hypothetical protein PRIEUP_LOCUS1901 [Pristimantis euphronides]
MMWVPNVTFLLLTLSTICYGDNPGFKFQITEQGLQKGVEYLLNSMMSNNTVYQLPDVTGSQKILSEDMKYEFKQIRMVELHHGAISSQWIPETGVHVLMENGDATINCNWKLDSWLIKDSGSSVVKLIRISISMMMGIQRIDPGVPSIYLVDCQASVQDVDVQMLDGISYIVENMKEPIKNVVRQNVNQQVCSLIREQVEKLDHSMKQSKLNETLNPSVELDLSLVGSPEISDQQASIGLKGLFRTRNESHSETAFSPAPMTLPVQDGAMFYIGVSQSSLDSFCSAYYTAGRLTFQVSDKVGTKELTTSTLAAYMPEISQHFPSPVPVKIQIYATKPPQLVLQSNNMTIQFGGSVRTYGYPSKAKTKIISIVDIVASFQASMSFAEAKEACCLNLTGSMILNWLQIEGSQPVVEGQQGVVTENGFQQMFREMLIPSLNYKLEEGLCFPRYFLKNASCRVQQGLVMLAADMK